MLMTPPFAFAQDKGNDGAKKSVPSAEVKAGKGREADGNSGKDAGAEKQGDKKKAGKAKKELSPAQKARHERRNQCNAQAGEKKGEARRQFMIACEKDLKKFNNDKKKAQQERLTSCNKQAGDKKLKDDDRKKFLGECLSAKK